VVDVLDVGTVMEVKAEADVEVEERDVEVVLAVVDEEEGEVELVAAATRGAGESVVVAELISDRLHNACQDAHQPCSALPRTTPH
jgi:hypothetical protein